MNGHLVAVEVGVEATAHQGVQADGVALDKHRLKGLDAHSVERRCPVEHHRVTRDDLLQDVPDVLVLALKHALGRLDGIGQGQLLEAPDDEGLEQLQRDLLGQATLLQAQLRPDDNDGPCGVVHALAEQVLTEATLLALDHVGQGLERAAG